MYLASVKSALYLMIRLICLTTAMTLFALAGQAQTVVERDAHDRLVGTVTRDGDRLIERDAHGMLRGTITRDGDRLIERDAHDRLRYIKQ